MTEWCVIAGWSTPTWNIVWSYPGAIDFFIISEKYAPNNNIKF